MISSATRRLLIIVILLLAIGLLTTLAAQETPFTLSVAFVLGAALNVLLRRLDRGKRNDR